VWPVVHARLTQRGLKSLPPSAALDLQARGKAVIVDCRPAYQWERERVAGSVNVPLYRPVEGRGAWDTVKRAVMAVGLAMTATERNPDFEADAAAALGRNKRQKLILYCSLGGTLTVGMPPWAPDRKKSFKDDPERAFGRESRSLKACYELLEAGWKDVVHMEGGLPTWRVEGLPVERGAP
jgi:rhodanese-related sulfurtransferase